MNSTFLLYRTLRRLPKASEGINEVSCPLINDSTFSVYVVSSVL